MGDSKELQSMVPIPGIYNEYTVNVDDLQYCPLDFTHPYKVKIWIRASGLILHTGLRLPFVLHLLVGTSCKKNASLIVHKDTNEQHNVRSSCWGSGAKQQPRPYPSSPPFLWQLKHLFVTQINYTYIQSWLIVFKLALVLSIADI